MNVVADESVDRPVVDRLRRDGHEVLYVAKLNPSIDDESVLGRANEHGALLITADKGFELSRSLPDSKPHHGASRHEGMR